MAVCKLVPDRVVSVDEVRTSKQKLPSNNWAHLPPAGGGGAREAGTDREGMSSLAVVLPGGQQPINSLRHANLREIHQTRYATVA